MPDNQVIGGNVRLFRDRLGLSQEELGAYLHTPREMISYYENGTRTIPTESLNRLADLFGIDPYDLLDPNPDKRAIQLVFAFRAGEMNPKAMEQIAQFKKIVLNYLHMKDALSNVPSH